MNRYQQKVVLLFGLLLISAALLGRANSAEAQAREDTQGGDARTVAEVRAEASDRDRGLVLTLGDMLFDAGKASLKPGAMTTIDRLAQFMRDYPERSVRIEGHTDSAGSEATNEQLSERRAIAVRDALLARGLDAARIEAVGYGETRPIASNDTPDGRAQNRRIEIVVSDEAALADGVARAGAP